RIFGGTLVALRIARVIEAGTVGLPGDAAPGGGEVHARHNVGEFLARGQFEDVRSGIFRAVFRNGGRNIFAAERWHEEVNRERSLGAGRIRIEDDLRTGG